MVSRAKKARTARLSGNQASASAKVTSTFTARLPQELMDAVIDIVLQEFDNESVREAQVKLRRWGPPPIKDEDKEAGQRRKRRSKAHDPTQLLTLSHVSRALRPRALRYLWKTLRFETIEEVDHISSLMATSGEYGRHVKRVEFAWTLKAPVRPHQDTLARFRLQVQPRATLVECAFIDRPAKVIAASEFKTYIKDTWFTRTIGPDGQGAIARIATPNELDLALVQIFLRLNRLQAIVWDGSVMPLSSSVAAAVDLATGGNLKSFGLIMDLKRVCRYNSLLEDTGVSVSHVPGLHSNLEHLYIMDQHESASDVNDRNAAIEVDKKMPFGIRVAGLRNGSRHEAPSAQWVVETCVDGAQNGLKAVTLRSDKLLQKQKLWPLWIFLDVRVAYLQRELYWTPEQKAGKGEMYSTILAALRVVRDAIQAFGGDKEGDWLQQALQPLSDELETALLPLKKQLAALGMPADYPERNTYYNKKYDLERRMSALRNKLIVLTPLLNDADLRGRVAKCWEEHGSDVSTDDEASSNEGDAV